MKDVGCNQIRHRRDQFGIVLVVRVKHHYDVCSQSQGMLIARLLISAVTPILFVLENMLYAKRLSHAHCIILAIVVNEDNIIHDVEVNFAISFLQGFCCIIRRQHYYHFLSTDHTQNLGSEKYKTLAKGANKRPMPPNFPNVRTSQFARVSTFLFVENSRSNEPIPNTTTI